MRKIFLTFIIVFLILINCSDKYSDFEPGLTLTGEVKFKSTNTIEKVGQFVYSVPTGYNPKTSWPLIITLHGYGSNAMAFHDLFKSVTDTMGFVLLTPQGDLSVENNFGWTWGDDSERLILTCLDLISKDIHIDRNRIYLIGFSAGGRLTYYLGLKYSNIFRGIATLSSPFDETILSGNKIINKSLKIYIGYGSLEKRISIEAMNAKSTLEKLGLNIETKRYDGIGHGLPEPKEKELCIILEYLNSKKITPER